LKDVKRKCWGGGGGENKVRAPKAREKKRAGKTALSLGGGQPQNKRIANMVAKNRGGGRATGRDFFSKEPGKHHRSKKKGSEREKKTFRHGEEGQTRV